MTYANCKIQAPAELITPQEITDIMQRAGTVEDIMRAVNVAKAYIDRYQATEIDYSDYHFLCMLSNVYQCGRLQGIREQRTRRRS